MYLNVLFGSSIRLSSREEKNHVYNGRRVLDSLSFDDYFQYLLIPYPHQVLRPRLHHHHVTRVYSSSSITVCTKDTHSWRVFEHQVSHISKDGVIFSETTLFVCITKRNREMKCVGRLIFAGDLQKNLFMVVTSVMGMLLVCVIILHHHTQNELIRRSVPSLHWMHSIEWHTPFITTHFSLSSSHSFT